MTFRQAETFLLSKNSPPAVPLNPTGPILTRYVSLSGRRTGISQDGISKGPRNKQRPVNIVCFWENTGHRNSRRRLPFMTQAVWKRFSYPNNCKQPGAMDLEETG